MKASITRRTVLLRSAITIAIVAILLAVYFAPSKPPAAAPLPVPNGYDDFIAAGKMLPGSTAYWWSDSNIVDLKMVLTTNQEPLIRARLGLTRETRAPVQYSQQYLAQQMSDLMKLKTLALALAADGKLAEAENRMDDAGNTYASIIELGVESGRGGFVINSLVQVAIEAIGAKRLSPIVPDLGDQASLQCLHAIQKAEADRDDFAKIQAQEELIYIHAPLGLKAATLAQKIVGRSTSAVADAKAKAKYQTSALSLLRLEMALAERAFALEKGRAATNWSDLVPAYLPRIPNDPTTNNLPMAFDSW